MIKQYKSLFRGLFGYFIIANTLHERGSEKAMSEIERQQYHLFNLVEKLDGKIVCEKVNSFDEYDEHIVEAFKKNFNTLSDSKGRFRKKDVYYFVHLA